MTTPKMEVVTVPFSAELVIDGKHFPLTSFSVQYVAHQVSTAQANLSVGFKGAAQSTRVSEAFVNHGTPAQISVTVDGEVRDPASQTILLKAGTYTAFDGYIDDVGPGNLQMGSFNVRARLVSKLATLNTGSLQVSRLAPTSYLDTTAQLRRFNNKQANVGVSDTEFTEAGLEEDFWHEVKRVLLAIANTGLGFGSEIEGQRGPLQEFIDFFNDGGNNPNVEAAAILDLLQGSLVPGLLRESGATRGLPDYLNVLFSGNFRMDSFLTRIRDLGQEFKFRLIESFNGPKVVPYSPFFTEDLATPIHPSTVHGINWTNQQPNNILGCAIMLGGASVLGNPTPNTTYLIGKYKRPIKATQLGAIPTFPGPNWLSIKNPLDGSSSGFAVDESMQSTIGNLYAKETALEMAYMGSMLQIEAPLRTDIGLLTPVKIIYPQIAGTDLGPAVYGSVQAVRLEADALSKKACTVMDIGYVRSQALQSLELASYQHPVWTEQYRGGRLDE